MATETIPRSQRAAHAGRGFAPAGVETLLDVLRVRAGNMPDETHLLAYDDRDQLSTLTFAELLAGAIPVPLYPPFRADRIEEYAARQTAILRNAQARVLVTFREAERLARL